MGMFIGSVPGKSPDGVTVSTNASGLLESDSIINADITDASTTSVSDVLLYTATLPFALESEDAIEVIITTDNSARNSCNAKVKLWDGVTEYDLGYSTAFTTGVYSGAIWYIYGTSASQVIYNCITQNSGTLTGTSCNVAAVGLPSVTQIRIYGKTSSGNCVFTSYRVVLKRKA